MAFITTKEQIKQANSSVTVDLDIKSLVSFLDDAEDIFRAIIGITSFVELEGASSSHAHRKMQSAIVNMALHLYADSGQLLISDSGMQVSKSTTLLPASDKKIVSFKRGVFKKAWQSFETSISLMESLIVDFPIWKDSHERKNYFSGFISDTTTFNFHSGIAITPDMFQLLRSEIRSVERSQVVPLLGIEFHNALITKMQDGSQLSAAENECRSIIRTAVASLALGESIPYRMIDITSNGIFQVSQAALSSQSDNIEAKDVPQARILQRAMNKLISVGEAELESLRIFMNANASSFTGYKTHEVAPMATFNDDLKDSNVYFM